jgi:hypothetical protein
VGLVSLGFALFLDCWGLLLIRLLEGAKREALSNYYYKLSDDDIGHMNDLNTLP